MSIKYYGIVVLKDSVNKELVYEPFFTLHSAMRMVSSPEKHITLM